MFAPPFGPPDFVRRAGSLHDDPLIGGTECMRETGDNAASTSQGFEDDPMRLAELLRSGGDVDAA